MSELVEILNLILEKSEKNKDGSLLVHKWIKNKIVRTLNNDRKKEKKVHKDKNITEKNITKTIVENKKEDLVNEFNGNGWNRRKARNKGYKK